ncbi:MAG: hypothetical protein ACETWK_11560 [Candidatus Aminicenantaceae bacterium]
MPKGHWRIAEAESVLGGCSGAFKQYEEAEPLLVGSYPVIRAKYGERNKRTQEALERIIRFYEAWGKLEKASDYRAMLKKSDEPQKPSRQQSKE